MPPIEYLFSLPEVTVILTYHPRLILPVLKHHVNGTIQYVFFRSYSFCSHAFYEIHPYCWHVAALCFLLLLCSLALCECTVIYLSILLLV